MNFHYKLFICFTMYADNNSHKKKKKLMCVSSINNKRVASIKFVNTLKYAYINFKQIAMLTLKSNPKP